MGPPPAGVAACAGGHPGLQLVPFGAPMGPPPAGVAACAGAAAAMAIAGDPRNLPQAPQVNTGPVPGVGIMTINPALGKGWTEHQTNEGRKYYYKAETSESSWSMPKEIQTPEQRAFEEETPWREYRIWDGRKFFYNLESKVSCWIPPPELTAIVQRINPSAVGKDLIAATTMKSTTTSSSTSTTSTALAIEGVKEEEKKEGVNEEGGGREVKKEEDLPVTVESLLPQLPQTVREKRKLYEELLRESKVDGSWTFSQAEAFFKTDLRASVIPVAMRRQCFVEHLMALQKKKAVETQMDQAHAKERLFEELLKWKDLCLTMTFQQLSESKFSRISKVWGYLTISERQAIFTDALEKYAVRYKKTSREDQVQAIPGLQTIFVSRSDIRPDLRWDEVKLLLKDDPTFNRLEPLEALRVWKAYQTLNAVQDEDTEIKKDRPGRKLRDKFMAVLDNFRARGETGEPWEKFVSKVKDHSAFIELEEYGKGSTPERLYHFSEIDQQRKRPRFGDEG